MKTPLQVAADIITDAKLPRGNERVATDQGESPVRLVLAPVPVARVIELIALAITQDRADTNIDLAVFDEIAAKVTEHYHDKAHPMAAAMRTAAKTALTFAQSMGARFTVAQPSEADYTEATTAACETFMSTLKDKGYTRD